MHRLGPIGSANKILVFLTFELLENGFLWPEDAISK